MPKKKNTLDFDQLLQGAHLPASKNTFSEAINEALEEFAPKNFLDKNGDTCQNNSIETAHFHQQSNTKNLQKTDISSHVDKKPQTKTLEEEIVSDTLFDKTHKDTKPAKPKSSKQTPHYLGHRTRLRERVLTQIHTAESYEILELLLGYVHGRKDTKPLAKELLQRFGSLWGVLNAHPTEISDIDNVGPSTKVFFTLIRELIARYFVEPIKAKKSVSIAEIVMMARSMLDGLPHEELWVALLDNNNRLLAFSQVQSGEVETVSCSARTLAEIAFSKKASALILIHNHPGGSVYPSLSDIETTKHMQHLLKQMGIRLLEHLIIADDNVISFMNNHILTKEENSSFFTDDNEKDFLS